MSRLFERRLSKSWARWSWARISLVVVLLAVATLVVYRTGGTSLVYVHLIYVPILAAAFFFGPSGGVITGLVAGVCVGPWMPIDVAHAVPQTPLNWLSRTGVFMLLGGLAGLMTSSLSRQIEQVRRHAHYDPVTRLPNRVQLLEDLDADLGEGHASTSVITLALPHYDTVVTTLGHRHADLLLQAAARRLRAHLADFPTLYDLGGGLFSTILAGGDTGKATAQADRLLHALQDPFVIEEVPILTGCQYGVACHPQHGSDSRALLRASIAALREAQRRGLPFTIYDDRNDRVRREVARLLPDLHNALRKRDELALHFQPKLRLEDGSCIGVEALIRWNHPERGAIPPGQFIGLAERTALIGPLTDWVIDAALRQLEEWQRDGIRLSIAINASVRNLEDPDLVRSLADRLGALGIDSSRLEIEVTESAFMGAPDIARRALIELRELGVSVALDDFGTGHSSLSYLRDLPANTLKLDRSFLRGLLTDRKSGLIVRSTIDTAHQLGFKVVGEGIEDGPTYERLRELACDMGQGFHICRPLPAPALRTWLDHNGARPPEAGFDAPQRSGQS